MDENYPEIALARCACNINTFISDYVVWVNASNRYVEMLLNYLFARTILVSLRFICLFTCLKINSKAFF